MEGVTKEDTEAPAKEAQTPPASENEAMEDVETQETPKQRLQTVDENVAMQDAVDMGRAAAVTGNGVASGRREEFRKRVRDAEEAQSSNPNARLKTGHEDGYVTEASMKSSTTLPRDNKHRGPDQQQLDYRNNKFEEGSVASMNDDASLASRNTWKSMASLLSHQKQLSDRRTKDKEKYASMSKEERRAYNAVRRDKYHRQSQEARQKQRQRARNRYHQGSVMSEAESIARKERRDKMQQEQLRSKQAVAATTET